MQIGDPGPGTGTANYRAFIFVNGWLIGRYVNNVGPQHQFYVPAGILNERGSNTLAVAVWGMDATRRARQDQPRHARQRGWRDPRAFGRSPAYSTAVYGPPAAPQPTLAAIPSSTLAKGTFAVKATLTNPTAGTGTIYCTDGSTQPFTLNVGNFWYRAGQNGNPANVLLASVDYANYPTGSSGHEVYVFERSVPLEQGKTVEAVTLPPLGDVVGYNPALHIFAMAVG